MATPEPALSAARPLRGVGPIGAYPPRQCFFLAYLDSHPAYAQIPRDEADRVSERRREAGLVFESAVFDRIRARAQVGDFGLVDLTRLYDAPGGWWPHKGGEATRATRDAMRDGADVIIGGVIRSVNWYPSSGLRDERVREAVPRGTSWVKRGVWAALVGKPDLLVLHRASGAYMPVDIKHHKAKTGAKLGTPARLGQFGGVMDFDAMPKSPGFASKPRRTDGFQLAHYLRILRKSRINLESAETPMAAVLRGGIIGSDCFSPTYPDGPIEIVWHDLGLPPPCLPNVAGMDGRAHQVRNRAKQKEWRAERTVYLEQGRALSRVVKNQVRGLTSQEPGSREEALAWGRLGKTECDSCERRSQCKVMAGADDASFAFKVGRPNPGGWAYLYKHGGDTVAELAGLDPVTHADAFKAAEKSFSKNAYPRALEEVVLRAQMIRDGELLKKRTALGGSGKSLGPLTHGLPRADVEIDFDIEWGEDGHVYQWGALVRRKLPDGLWSVGDYDSLTRLSFEPLDEASARALSDDFFSGLRSFVEAEEKVGRTVQIYHWTAPEETKSDQALGHSNGQANTIDELLPGLRLDLHKWVKGGWWSANGYSIKVVAPACGFAWEVDDPGGAMSMVKIEQCRARKDDWKEAGEWLRAYNRSDCAAQAAVRDRLAEWRP